ncbi:MAG: hypothetical protein QM793_14670 [Muricomes sp.]
MRERSIACLAIMAMAICGKPPEGRTPEERMRLEKEARALEIAVETGEPENDAALVLRLEAFLAKVKTGRASVEVRLMLAKVLLRLGQETRANHEAFVVLEQHGILPRHRDGAKLIQAETLLRSGQAALAIDILAPLLGQLFDLADRRACARFLVEASLVAPRYELVFKALLDWLELERMPVSSLTVEIDKTLAKIPVATLRKLPAPAATKPESEMLREVLVERVERRLTDTAVEQNDAELAREVLRRKPNWLRGTPEYEALVKLSSLLEEEAKVIGRRVGIVLGGKSGLERSRGVALMMGFVDELGTAKKSDVSVLSEDDGGSVSEALSRLTSDGASLLIAGFRAETSLEALRFAEDRKVAVLAIAPPLAVPPSSFGFSAGPADEMAEGVLRRVAKEKGFPEPVLVSEESCDLAPGATKSPLLLLAGPDCLRVMLRGSSDVPFLLGLDVSAEPLPLGREIFFLRSHDFPAARRTRGGLSQAGADEKTPRAKGFYELLGHDLARLVALSFEALPDRELEDRAAVLARYSELRDRLLRAKAELATTRLSGFTPQNSLGHELLAEPWK